MSYLNVSPHKDHRNSPAISIYITRATGTPELTKWSCGRCKRTIFDVHGTIDRIIDAPMHLGEVDVAVNILCKQCHQPYRILLFAN